ncbi:MAG TPA: nitrilase-related carbon-nitrogen hydrolase [Streptosporangiaceae bacterium]
MTIIAVCQLGLSIGDLVANAAAAERAVAEAAAQSADLVVIPELSDTGYVFASAAEARALASPVAGNPTLGRWRELAATHRTVIAGGFCELGSDGLLYNSAAVVDASGTRAVYRKTHLWDAETLIFTPGSAPPPLARLPFGTVALMVCYDLEFPEWVRLAALAGADLIAAPVNWPAAVTPAGERPAEVVKAQADAATNGVFIAVADRCQDERGVSWVGGSIIVGPDGYPLAGPVLADRPAVLTARCELAAAADKRINDHNDLLADRRPGLYGPVAAARPGPTPAGS